MRFFTTYSEGLARQCERLFQLPLFFEPHSKAHCDGPATEGSAAPQGKTSEKSDPRETPAAETESPNTPLRW